MCEMGDDLEKSLDWHDLSEDEYLDALAPSGWVVGSLDHWRAFPWKSTSKYGAEFDAEFCTIQIPLTRNPTPYILKVRASARALSHRSLCG